MIKICFLFYLNFIITYISNTVYKIQLGILSRVFFKRKSNNPEYSKRYLHSTASIFQCDRILQNGAGDIILYTFIRLCKSTWCYRQR